jgi:signal recognition particle receptor subunit beta
MFTELGDPPYSLEDVLAPPMILMIGQFSTGKTTFIKALLGKDYPMMKIAAAAATDNFTAIVRGLQEDEVLGATVVSLTLEYLFCTLRLVPVTN